MKTSRDPRHLKRAKIIKELFAWQFYPKNRPISQENKEIIDNLAVIDREIEGAAPEWPIRQINKIDLAILRLAIFELIIKHSAPYKVIADENVELAKEFGSQSSPAFINGVLGKIITAHKLDKLVTSD